MKKFFALFFLFAVLAVWADDNFKWSLENGRINLVIAENCYLYADSVKIKAEDKTGHDLQIVMPHPVKYNDEFAGEVQIFKNGKYSLKNRENMPVAAAEISYQGCQSAAADAEGICFMPQKIVLGGTSEKNIAKNVGKNGFASDFEPVRKHEGTMSVDEMLKFLDNSQPNPAIQAPNWWAGKSVWLILLILLGGGFLLNFTPCILPMIPINLAIIGAGGEKTPFAGFLRGVYYAIGMTCAYGALGMAVILSGAKFGELNSNMYFNFVISLIFFALALAMAGVWNLDFSAKLNSINPMKWKVGRPIAIFFMGATAALLGGACVAPAVVGMLVLALATYKIMPAAGLAVPFVFGIGMGILWIAAGATMGKILPKPGKWMVYVKNIMAIFIALFGIYYLYIGITLIPGRYDSVKEIENWQTALNEAKNKKCPVFVDFWASWCKNCAYMDKNVLENQQVKDKLSAYVVVKFQAENLKDPNVAAILEKYNIQGLPAFVILKEKRQ